METIRIAELRGIVIPEIQEIFSGNGYRIVSREDRLTSQIQVVDPVADRIWVHYSLRNRSMDGPTWVESALSTWPARGAHDIPVGNSIEESKYWLDPRYPLSDEFDPHLCAFVENPFEQIPYRNPSQENLLQWYTMWRKLLDNPKTPFPGYYSLKAINGAARGILKSTLILLGEKGFTHLTSVPTWYHVAKLNEHMGFKYSHKVDADRMREFAATIEAASANVPSPIDDRRIVTSWNAVLQYWAELTELQGLDPELIVQPGTIVRSDDGRVLTYPLRPEYNLWQEIEAA